MAHSLFLLALTVEKNVKESVNFFFTTDLIEQMSFFDLVAHGGILLALSKRAILIVEPCQNVPSEI